MKSPLCEVCLTSNILCGGCSSKLEKEEISQADIDVSRFIHKLSDRAKSLQEATLLKAIDADVLLLVAGKGDGAKLVGKAGAVVKALAKKYGKSIKVLEKSEFRPFVIELLRPLTVTGFNVMYTPEGEVYKIRAPLSQKQKQYISEATLAEVSQKLFGKKVELIFDD